MDYTAFFVETPSPNLAKLPLFQNDLRAVFLFSVDALKLSLGGFHIQRVNSNLIEINTIHNETGIRAAHSQLTEMFEGVNNQFMPNVEEASLKSVPLFYTYLDVKGDQACAVYGFGETSPDIRMLNYSRDFV